jgi:hypothetical protein
MACEQKTKSDTGDVSVFLAQVEDPFKRSDSQVLIELMQDVVGEPPVLWGSMIGFGRYHYRYPTGTEGESFLLGFAPRKAEFSIYLAGLPEGAAERETLLPKLGSHRMGKGCLYIKRLSDIDLDILRQLAELAVRNLRLAYPAR